MIIVQTERQLRGSGTIPQGTHTGLNAVSISARILTS